MKQINIGNKLISNENSCYLIAEIGINHNGDLDNVIKLMNNSKDAGFDCVKFQKGLLNYHSRLSKKCHA